MDCGGSGLENLATKVAERRGGEQSACCFYLLLVPRGEGDAQAAPCVHLCHRGTAQRVAAEEVKEGDGAASEGQLVGNVE